MCVFVHLCMHVCASVYACMCMYVCMHVCALACVCVCVCMYTGSHPDRCRVLSCLSVSSTLWTALVHRSGLLPPLVNCLTFYFHFGLMVYVTRDDDFIVTEYVL